MPMSLHDFRKTKIVATLGPATESAEMLERLILSGVNVLRLNMSHARPDWVRRIVGDIRTLAQRHRRAVGVLLDTQGPSIRTGDVAAKIPLGVGERFTFTVRGRVPEAGTSQRKRLAMPTITAASCTLRGSTPQGPSRRLRRW